MKKPSLRRYRSRSSVSAMLSPGAFAALIFAVVLLILAIIRFAAPDTFIAIATPVWRVGTSLSASVGVGAEGLTSGASLARQRDDLAKKNDELTAQNRTLAAKAQDLQNLLGTRTQPPAGILSAVVARPPVAPYDVLIVDQGSDAHVALGAAAFGPGGTPIGTVASVERTSARITLYSNPGLDTDAWAGDTRVPITLSGAGSGGFTATLPKTAGVAVGQGVYVAAAGAVPVGTVASVGSDPSSPNVVLHIHPYLNPFSLTWVTISVSGL